MEEELLHFDRQHIMHPYTSMIRPLPTILIKRALKCSLYTADEKELIDGMASWWSVIHGYNHPVLNEAIYTQTKAMSHVMFGGITHEPAIRLSQLLVQILPQSLNRIFFSDSGSVAVEVALKMAIQYWIARKQPKKTKFLTFRGGYFGDTLHAMSLADPDNGMHAHFKAALPQQHFLEKPKATWNEQISKQESEAIVELVQTKLEELAGIIVEPIVQGAGGMHIYSPSYLETLRNICDQHDLLLIFDEIATGFARTGKLFAHEHSTDSTPDIMTVGKALTGGYLTLAATITSEKVSDTISSPPLEVFMHGPTFMANPLACSVAYASLKLLIEQDYQALVARIEIQLKRELLPLAHHPQVRDVRIIGSIGVVETCWPIDIAKAQQLAIKNGVWLRPFRNLIYIMPPYIITEAQLTSLTRTIAHILDFPIFNEQAIAS